MGCWGPVAPRCVIEESKDDIFLRLSVSVQAVPDVNLPRSKETRGTKSPTLVEVDFGWTASTRSRLTTWHPGVPWAFCRMSAEGASNHAGPYMHGIGTANCT